MRILVVEDETKLAEFISKALTNAGHSAEICLEGNEAAEKIATREYDAIVLDVMLPGRDGLDLLRHMRQTHDYTPVLLLTARGSTPERIEGLNLGADDYMAKPFDMDELLARVNALLRRVSAERTTVLESEDLIVNLVTRQVTRSGKKIDLTPREFGLLEFMMRTPGRAYTRAQLCEHVWNWRFDSGTNVVEVYIQRIRRKIDENHTLKFIHTVRGVGYVFDPRR